MKSFFKKNEMIVIRKVPENILIPERGAYTKSSYLSETALVKDRRMLYATITESAA